MASTEFELEGKRYEVRRLSPDDACLGLEVLGRAIGPAAAQILGGRAEGEAPDFGAILQALLSNASQLSVLLKLFAPRAKFDRGGNGIMVEMKPFTDELFAGRLDLLIAFLTHTVRGEYAFFFAGNSALVGLLAEFSVSVSASPKAPTV
jgi:hypothetical protein